MGKKWIKLSEDKQSVILIVEENKLEDTERNLLT